MNRIHVRSFGVKLAACAMLGAAQAAGAQDVLRIDELRQDIAELRRQLAEQSRRIDELERRLAVPQSGSPSRSSHGGSSTGSRAGSVPTQWLDGSRWDRVRPGATEAEVVALLGPPTSTRRANDGSLTLLYALELSGSGYLGGRVVLHAGRVSEVLRPELR